MKPISLKKKQIIDLIQINPLFAYYKILDLENDLEICLNILEKNIKNKQINKEDCLFILIKRKGLKWLNNTFKNLISEEEYKKIQEKYKNFEDD